MVNYTKNAIIQIFMKQLEFKSLDKITVKDIIEEADVNRNTFYYHFKDIYDLIDQIFEEELRKNLSEMKEETTFYEEYRKAAAFFLDHKKAIIHIENSKSRDIMHHYIEEVTEIYVEKFVRKHSQRHKISEEGIKFITYFYSSAIIANTIRWIQEGMPGYRNKFLKIVSMSFEKTIDCMIDNYIVFEKE